MNRTFQLYMGEATILDEFWFTGINLTFMKVRVWKKEVRIGEFF